MAVMHETVDDPQLVAAANVFVDEIIETAKVEAAQRNMVIFLDACGRPDHGTPGAWSWGESSMLFDATIFFFLFTNIYRISKNILLPLKT